MTNTSRIGEVCVAQVLCALVKRGKRILLPFGDSSRYDLVVEEDDGRFVRIQCKNGRLTNGAISFYSCSVDSRSETGRCIRKSYHGEVDGFGVYCPENGKSYLIPVAAVGDQLCVRLRTEPPLNNQRKGIRWAEDYEIGTAPEIGTYSGLSVEGEFVIIHPTD